MKATKAGPDPGFAPHPALLLTRYAIARLGSWLHGVLILYALHTQYTRSNKKAVL